MTTSLPPIDVVSREAATAEAVRASDAEAIIVTSPSNIRWLTGFAGSSATVLVSDATITLFTDNRYRDRAPRELAAVSSTAAVEIATTELGERIAAHLDPGTSVALEADHITWSQQQRISTEWLPDSELVPTSALIDGLRATKDSAEIARIERAASIVDRALATVVHRLNDSVTELEFAAELDAAIRSGGADDIGFDTIVASGANGAIPHHQPVDRVIERGDLVIVDVGGRVDGYRSDMTRTFCVGPMNPDQVRHYETVAQAQQAGVDAMVVGASTADVDAAAREVIADAGWQDAFTHGTGHGIGLDIHELPRVAASATDEYRAGTVATVEPGVYLRGEAGVRVEDTCVAQVDGARRLTKFPKDPEI